MNVKNLNGYEVDGQLTLSAGREDRHRDPGGETMNEQEKAIKEMQDASYGSFLKKFETKKTTDDCYTPDNIYNAVADFVAEKYGRDKRFFVRPFWPGGDYKTVGYMPDDTVVDNPPFSILSQIISYYHEKGVKFFLFAPTLTLFSSSSSSSSCAIPLGVGITYENGATVKTSFLTNLEEAQVHTYPELYKKIEAENKRNEKQGKKTLPKYEYPDEIITAAQVARWCKYGIEYTLNRSDCERIGTLDAQRKIGKSIFGNGYILSERAAAERAAAERAAAERAAAERWKLSSRERNIVYRLSGKPETAQEEPEIPGQMNIFDFSEVMQ